MNLKTSRYFTDFKYVNVINYLTSNSSISTDKYNCLRKTFFSFNLNCKFCLLIIFGILSDSSIIAQKYLPESYYLINNLDTTGFVASDIEILEKALKNYHSTKSDTDKIAALDLICEEMQNDYWKQYQFYQYNFIQNVIEKNKDTKNDYALNKSLSAALNNIAVIYHSEGDLDKALEFNNKSLKIKQDLKDNRGIAASYNNIGMIYKIKGDQSKALENFNLSLKLQEEDGYERGVEVSLSNIGSTYRDMGNMAKAIEFSTRALKLAEKLKLDDKIGSSLINIGGIYDMQDDSERAEEFFRKSIPYLEKIGNLDGLGSAYGNLAKVYFKNKQYAKALENHAKAIEIFKSANNILKVGISYGNMGACYSAINNSTEALKHYNLSINILNEVGETLNYSKTLANIANEYLKLKDSKNAKIYAIKAYNLSKSINSPDAIRFSSAVLKEIELAQGNYKAAFEYFKEEITMKDSIKSKENYRATEQQRVRYEYDKKFTTDSLEFAKKQEMKDLEISNQQIQINAKNLQRNASIGGLGLMMLLAIVFFTQRNRISKEKDKSENLLLNILPYETAQELKAKGSADAKLIDHVTVLFTDFKGFTAMAEKLSPQELVTDLNICFSEFDRIMEKYGIEKIKTIGDSYMAAGGLPTPNETHASDVVKAAFEITQFIEEGKQRKLALGMPYFEIRIGIHTGHCRD
jgi:adenylate cyclase